MNEVPPHLRDRIRVVRDERKIEVYGHVTVSLLNYVRSGSRETHVETIESGDGGVGKPEALTAELAETLHDEFGISVGDHGIQAIDVRSDEVDIL